MKKLLGLFLSLITSSAFAQNVEMADTMRSEGKIYVVVGIILLVLLGLFIYLFLIDRKVAKLEQKVSAKQQGNR